MSKFGSTLEIHARIGEVLNKLKSDKLEIDEFENLLDHARELYERLLILRYKAFEKYASGQALPNTDDDLNTNLSDQLSQKQTDLGSPSKEDQSLSHVPKDVEQLIVDSDDTDIEFALFGETLDSVDLPLFGMDFKQDETKTIEKEDLPVIQEDQIIPTASIQNQTEIPVIQEDQIIPTASIQNQTEISVNTTQSQSGSNDSKSHTGGSLLDQFSNSSNSNRLADQLKKSRIESIAVTLTLNDRIRFSKNLFGGNSETFNASVQLLDAQKSMMEALELLRQYSERFHWDQDEKTTMDFYDLVERLHA
jgi:hypothetical protein